MSIQNEFPSLGHQPTEDVRDVTEPYQDYLAAVARLHPYPSAVVRRESVGSPESLPYATIHEERLTFEDGVVRTLTRVDPKANYFAADQLNPYVVSAGDALGTGPSGFNRTIIDGLARRGFAVAWLHHQGRHTEIPKDLNKALSFAAFVLKKSVGRSAHHQHGMLNSLAEHSQHDTSTVISIGDSRSSMTGEAVDALAPSYGRRVLVSYYIASCFEHRPKLRELPLLATSLPNEGMAFLRLMHDLHNNPDVDIADYFGTFDFHPKNIINEIAWLVPLMRGDAGHYADAIPLDQNGIRVHLDGDIWSSGGKAWEHKYTIRPNMHLIKRGMDHGRKARHLDIADPSVQAERFARLGRVTEEVVAGHAPDQIDMRYVARGIKPVPTT